MSHLTLKMG